MSKKVLLDTLLSSPHLVTSSDLEGLDLSDALAQVQYLHGLLLGPDSGIWEWHPHSGFQQAMGRVWNQLHQDAETALRHVWTGSELSLVHSDDRDNLFALRNRLCMQGKFADTTVRAYGSDGQQLWLRLWARAYTDSDDNRFFLGGCADYSEAMAARYLSNLPGERPLQALTGVGDGLWEWDLRADEVVIDQACWNMLGYEQGHSDGPARAALKQWKTHMLPEDYPRVQQAIDDHVRERLPLDVEHRLYHREGGVIWVRLRGKVQCNSAGRPVRVLGILQDISASREVQVQMERELEHLRSESRGKSELLSSLSHELRTPLNAVLGYSQMVELDQTLNPDQRTRIGEIRKAGQHLLHLVGDVLDLARIDSNRLAPSIEPIQPAALVADCKHLLEPLAETRRVSLIFEPLGWDGAYILADPVRFKQVVLNLVGNAVKYNRDHGRVVVNFAPQAEGWLRLSVLDTGMGIAQEKRSQVFEPFNRLGAENSQIEGTGVGLAIARQLTEAMGGRIDFDSQEGQGSVFWIEFPLIGAPPEVMQMVSRPSQSLMLSECRILHLVSQPAAAVRLKTFLAGMPQIEVMTSGEAMEGIFSARTNKPDILIFDCDLPGISCRDLVTILRADPLTKDIRLLAIDDNSCSFADATLEKNFDQKMLIEHMNYCLHELG